MEGVVVKEWIKNNPRGDGYGSGYGDGYGYGSGSGYGDGDGYGYGYGDGYGYGSGSGYGDGDGYGYGSGYGYGDGDGYGYGYGYGDGDGYGLGKINGKTIHMIDGVQTIIEHIKENVAHGYILNNQDLTLAPCFVVKGREYFAHGKTLKEANAALREKIFSNMDPEKAIEKFMGNFKKGKKYLGTDFFEWHHFLTGSCLMGRESFVKNHGFDLNAEYTVDEFIAATENDYGSKVIKQLKEKWALL